jgi:hypothetical protein
MDNSRRSFLLGQSRKKSRFLFCGCSEIRYYAWASVTLSNIAQARVSTSALFAIVEEEEFSLQGFRLPNVKSL